MKKSAGVYLFCLVTNAWLGHNLLNRANIRRRRRLIKSTSVCLSCIITNLAILLRSRVTLPALLAISSASLLFMSDDRQWNHSKMAQI